MTNTTPNPPLKRTRQEINKANAQKSTGPRTAAGKAKSSLCALRHGITSQVVLMPEEDMSAYKTFTQRYHDDFKPKGVYEEQLVQTLADTQWRLNRIRSLENTLLALGHNRMSDGTITEHVEVHAALATAAGIKRNMSQLALISTQEQRLTKQIRAAYKDLSEIQSARKKEEAEALREAAKLYQLHLEDHPQTPETPEVPAYAPAADGFVLQIPEIVRYIDFSTRSFRAGQASIERAIHAYERTHEDDE